MSTKYKKSSDVPLDVLLKRLDELADAACNSRETQDREFTMRIPAECDRDADLVISEAMNRIKALQHRVSELEDTLKRQGNVAKTGMDAAKRAASQSEKNAKRLQAESNPESLESERAMNEELTHEIDMLQDSLIWQGKMLAAIANVIKGPPEEGSLHSTHDVVECVTRLQARVQLEQEPEAPAPMLHWSRPAEPDLTNGYSHVTAETPFGRFLITWKGWKDYDAPAVDETPWGGYWNAFATVAGAKRACETTYNDLLAAAYEGGHS